MKYVSTPAVVSSLAAPFGLVGGWAVAGLMWPEFNPVIQTISELAAGDAPTAVLMNTMFVLAGLCHMTTAWFSPGIALLGRIALGLAGLASIGVAVFPLPTVLGTSTEHRVVAAMSFVLLAVWPLLGWRQNHPVKMLRPLPMIASAIVLGSLCLWFFAVWSDLGGTTGLVERIAVAAEALFPAFIVYKLNSHSDEEVSDEIQV
ncbi:MAG: hypothetical protein RLZZ426_859 [Actinomycetota bacterium]|jgi:hypothetical membrane protein